MEAKLLSHKGATTKVDRAFLDTIETPERTDTFQPIAHAQLVATVEESLAFRHIKVERSEFAVSSDGMKMFGLLEVNQVYEGVNFAIGLRNANDKSMRLGMVAGYRVIICDNQMLAGDFTPMLQKHSKHLDLIEAVSMGVDRIQRGWNPLREQIDYKRRTRLQRDQARLLIYNAFTRHKLPVSLFNTVSKSFESDEGDITLWGIEQHFTDAFKQLKPIAQFQAGTKLPKALEPGRVWPGPVIDIQPTEPSPDQLN